MKKLFLFICLFSSILLSQDFTLEEYKQFLNTHQNMTPSQLLQMHDAGTFKANIAQVTDGVTYFDSICLKYNLTEYEKSLVKKHGFMVSERLSFNTFGEAYKDIFFKDMPVFVSTDAILHAVHKSYDMILVSIEGEILIPKLKEMLNAMHGQMSSLNAQYGSDTVMLKSLKDYDIYFGIAKKLMGLPITYFYPENVARGAIYWDYIVQLQPREEKFFCDTTQFIDFSQLKPRGHYTSPENLQRYPDLMKYFQAMMWLGRTELYLLPPAYHSTTPCYAVRRSAITSALTLKAAKATTVYNSVAEFSKIINFMVGDDDNVNLYNLENLMADANITDPRDLVNNNALKRLQDSLLTKGYAFQRINSQILRSDQNNPDSLVPASSFLLMGQKFIIDSYITSQVVFDRIKYLGHKILRMRPSTLDVLFGLGNDASIQLLQAELETFKYSTNLASLRFLIDAFDTTFWNANLFNAWLNSIRKLNPPALRNNLPLFMRSGAYWQQKMNTQLGSWTELRHDNLLYAKQSYTFVPICSFPYGYVEPFPEFYDNLKIFGTKFKQLINPLSFIHSGIKSDMLRFCDNLIGASDTLSTISTKELNNIPLSTGENNFLKSMLRDYRVDYTGLQFFDGWYWRLYFECPSYGIGNQFWKKDFLVADIHTTPADSLENWVGWIKHVGTGPINLGTFIAEYPTGTKIAYMGAFYSYYDYQTNDFLRLTDEEWDSTYRALALRPDFVNLYLANTQGGSKGNGSNLFTDVTNVNDNIVPDQFTLLQNYPNPFNSSTVIKFSIPADQSNEIVSLNIYDIQGQLVKRIIHQPMSSGNYMIQWNGTNNSNLSVSSGIYICRGSIGKYDASIKLMLLK